MKLDRSQNAPTEKKNIHTYNTDETNKQTKIFKTANLFMKFLKRKLKHKSTSSDGNKIATP